MKTKKETLAEIQTALANEDECYIFLAGTGKQMYTCINPGSKIQPIRYGQSHVFDHTEDTIYSIPYKGDTSMDDYSMMQGMLTSLGLPDIASLVCKRFDKNRTAKFSALSKYMHDYKCGIRVTKDGDMYITNIVYGLCNDKKPYSIVQATRGASDCLEKALLFSMQNINLNELIQSHLTLKYNVDHLIPTESHLYPIATDKLTEMDKNIEILKKQKYFTGLIPEKSFEM